MAQTETTRRQAGAVAAARPDRRGMFTMTFAALAAGTIASRCSASAATVDPLVQIADRIIELEGLMITIAAKAEAIRLQVGANCAAQPAWQKNDAAETALINEQIELINQALAIPATTPAGIAAKCRVALLLWPRYDDDREYDWHESVARAAILDAVRLLEGEG